MGAIINSVKDTQSLSINNSITELVKSPNLKFHSGKLMPDGIIGLNTSLIGVYAMANSGLGGNSLMKTSLNNNLPAAALYSAALSGTSQSQGIKSGSSNVN